MAGATDLGELAIRHYGFEWVPWRRDPKPWLLAWDQVGVARLGFIDTSDRLVTERDPDGSVFVDATLSSEEPLLHLLKVDGLSIGRVRVRGFPAGDGTSVLREALAKIPRVELLEGWSTI